MKTIVLHGEDTLKSYERLKKFIDEAKKRNWEILYDNLSETPSLFGQKRLIILRDFKLFTKKFFDGTLVIYHEGTLPVAFLKSLKEPKVEEFKLPKIIWKFLDNMTINGLHELVKTQAVEYVFAMIVWKMKKTKPNLISKLAEIDYLAKTGKVDLLLSLDLLLLKHIK